MVSSKAGSRDGARSIQLPTAAEQNIAETVEAIPLNNVSTQSRRDGGGTSYRIEVAVRFFGNARETRNIYTHE